MLLRLLLPATLNIGILALVVDLEVLEELDLFVVAVATLRRGVAARDVRVLACCPLLL